MNLIRLLRTSTFRLALLYMVLFSSSVLLLFIFIYWETVWYMAAQTDETIDTEIQGLVEQYQRQGLNGLVRAITERANRNPRETLLYLLAAPDYTYLAGNLTEWPLVAASSDNWLNFQHKDHSTKSQYHPARARHFLLLPGRLHLLLGREVQELKAVEALILRALSWGLAITVGLALFGGLMMSWSTLRRLESMNQTCRDIMKGDLSRRIPTQGTSDDFDQLADNLNSMLDKIEILMAGVRQVADNIAHDLRTPLTRLRNRLELLRQYSSTEEHYEEFIDKNISEADQLLATFNALLRIAQIESGSLLRHHAEVNLVVLVQDAAELYEALAYDKQQQLTLNLASEVTVSGDRDLLFQALANLLDNAVKYTPVGGQIRIILSLRGGFAEIRLMDTGPGIPLEARDKVFERFYRLETSRNTPGNGLGLSLVAAVAKFHHSQIILEDQTPGLCVIWRLPLGDKEVVNNE